MRSHKSLLTKNIKHVSNINENRSNRIIFEEEDDNFCLRETYCMFYVKIL